MEELAEIGEMLKEKSWENRGKAESEMKLWQKNRLQRKQLKM